MYVVCCKTDFGIDTQSSCKIIECGKLRSTFTESVDLAITYNILYLSFALNLGHKRQTLNGITL